MEQVTAGLTPHGVSMLPLQLTLLYEEVLYTILHRLGKPEHQHVADPQELYAYVQKVGPHLTDGGLQNLPPDMSILPAKGAGGKHSEGAF